MTAPSLAILVDGDNITATLAGQLLRKTADLGRAQVRRAYCAPSAWKNWAEAPSFYRIQVPAEKNAADIQLSIDAMGFALTEGIETFALASSDGDLSLVAHRLREMGRRVVGFGLDKAPDRFRLACDEFQTLTLPGAQQSDDPDDRIEQHLRAIFATHDPKGQGIPLNKLNGLVRRVDPSIKISQLSAKTWPNYLKARTNLYRIDGEGNERCAYFVNSALASRHRRDTDAIPT